MTEVHVSHLALLAEAVDDVDARWLDALGGSRPSAVVDDDVQGMSDAGLLALNEALAAVERQCRALHARIANGISERSNVERGKDGLARRAGFRTPEKLISAATGGHPAEAKKLIQVGDATAGRMTFTGERAPARHPHIARAVAAGRISVDAASAITRLLDKVACKADRGTLNEAEGTLAEQAAGLSLQELHVVLRHAEAWLDPDGLEPKIESLHAQQYLKFWEDRQGMICFDGKFAPDSGAPVKAALEAMVTAQIRAMRGHNHPSDAGSGSRDGSGTGEWVWSSHAADGSGDADPAGGLDADASIPGLVERRNIPQLNADALVAICRHALGCDQSALPLATTTVIVRIPLEALTTGTGIATIDGIAQPIDAGTARRLAADAEIIPLVLGADSEILDCGRTRRLFTRAQRLSLWERDGGCAGCGAPPQMCEVHHLTWWSHGGTTNLDNGILLCTSCHHRIHADGWEIRIEGSDVWFTPPPHVDPTRTPIRGGSRRFHYRPAA